MILNNMDCQDSLIARINEVMIHFGLNISEFAAKADIAQGNMSSMLNKKRTIGDGVLNKICISFEISKSWLLTGEGKMLKKDEDAYINSIAPDPPEHIQYFFDKIDERDQEIKRLNAVLIEKERENGNLRALISKLETMLQSNGIDSKQTGS